MEGGKGLETGGRRRCDDREGSDHWHALFDSLPRTGISDRDLYEMMKPSALAGALAK